ncbi:MAG: ATP-binding protein [Thiohalobacteraceae bacterium]
MAFRSGNAPSLDADRRDSLTWKPLRLLTLYRLILAGLLTGLFFVLPQSRSLGDDAPWLFGLTSLGYLGFALVAGFAARLRRPGYVLQVVGQILVDIVVIVLLMHAGGGLGSGLGILLILAVAAGALLLPGRMAYFFAAVGTLALLIELGLSILTDPGASGLTRAGMLGAALFTTAIIAHLLARRIRETEELAEQRGVDLANLSRLNEHVIQRLQSGILVVDENNHLHLMNDTAWVMLQAPRGRAGGPLHELSPELGIQLQRWRSEKDFVPEIFTPELSQASLLPRFTALGASRDKAVLIFLEDTAALAQQAQQMKLAALGRLTASIAHEIRNPLGAISHAGQLLAESPHLDSGEQRLTEIIRTHSQRMNSIIEDVLQLSRRGQIHPKELDLKVWLQEFIGELTRCERLRSEQVCLSSPDGDFPIRFDPGHLQQVVWNLSRNALQHGGGALELRLGTTAARMPCLDVLDRGSGIDETVEPQIFEPFFTTSTSGTGLGLYLSRELCELNRARLTYEPRSGGGSRFRVSFSL